MLADLRLPDGESTALLEWMRGQEMCIRDRHFQPVAILQQRMEIDLLLLPFVAQASRTDLQQLFQDVYKRQGGDKAACIRGSGKGGGTAFPPRGRHRWPQ